MLEIIFSILKNKTLVVIILIALALAAVGGTIGYFQRRAKNAEAEAKREREDKERIAKQNEGLKIIVGSSNSVGEVKKLEEEANAQSQNSNISNADFSNSFQRDSNSFSGNFDQARQRFCRNFPNDSRCRN